MFVQKLLRDLFTVCVTLENSNWSTDHIISDLITNSLIFFELDVLIENTAVPLISRMPVRSGYLILLFSICPELPNLILTF